MFCVSLDFFEAFDALFTFYFISVICIVGPLGDIVFNYCIENPDVEKNSTYECGFEPYDSARNTFDIHFYLVALLFLIFDLEIAFFLPLCYILPFIDLFSWGIGFDFIIELGIGFIYIWAIGALDWG